MSTEDLIGAAAESDGPPSDAVFGTVASVTLSLENGQRTTAARALSVAVAVPGDSVGPGGSCRMLTLA